MEVALDRHLGWQDLILGSTPLGHAANAAYRGRHGLCDHSTWAEITAVCGPELIAEYFGFALVRHPLHRMLSLYNFLHSLITGHAGATGQGREELLCRVRDGSSEDDPDFMGWAAMRIFAGSDGFSAFLRAAKPAADPGFRPQVDFLSAPPGMAGIDCVIRLEDLARELPQLSARLNLSLDLPHLNRSRFVATSVAEVTLSERRFVQDCFAADYLAFDYSLD